MTHHSFALLAALAVSALAGQARADVTITDNKKTVEVDCAKHAEVNLLGNHITVTARGVCARLRITGNHATVTGSFTTVHIPGNKNTVKLAAADDLLIDGNENTVTIAAAVTRKAPRIANTGNKNRITPGT